MNCNYIINILVQLKDWVPFFQSLIWPIFISALVMIYRRNISGLVAILANRIVNGTELKTPFFEIGRDITTQSREELKLSPKEDLKENSLRTQEATEDYLTVYYLAEALIMRRLQSEFNALIQRQVKLWGVISFDGSFEDGGVTYGVKFKVVRAATTAEEIIQKTKIHFREINEFAFPSYIHFKLLFVLVFESDEVNNKIEKEKILLAARTFFKPEINIEIRFYSFSELKKSFGL